MKIDKSHIDTIEHGIAPPLGTVITLPTSHKDVVIYVCVGALQVHRDLEEDARAVTEVAQALQLVPPPVMEPLDPAAGDHMTWKAFLENIDDGAFTDDDGFGELATADQCSNVTIHPSDVDGEIARAEYKRPDWATHVVWYNK